MSLPLQQQDDYQSPVTVYTLPNCVQCVAVKRAMNKHGIAYRERDLRDPAHLEYVKALGYLAAPVTVANDGTSFQGYQPGKVRALLDN